MEAKKTIKVSLKVKEIVFDVMNKTHLTGVSRMAQGASNYEAGAHMQASEDAEHSYQIRRSISNAFSHLKTELGEYLQEDVSSTNNIILRAVDNIDLDDDPLAYVREQMTGKNFTDDKANGIKSSATTPYTDWTQALKHYNDMIDEVEEATEKAQIKKIYDEALGRMAVLELTFLLPSNFNNSACDSLGGGLHEYIVNRAVYDWFSITNKADAADYLAMAQASLESTKKALYKRERPTRPTYTA